MRMLNFDCIGLNSLGLGGYPGWGPERGWRSGEV